MIFLLALSLANVQSPALRQLEGIESQAPDEEQSREKAKAAGGLGFTVKTLSPVGYVGEMPGEKQGEPRVPARPRYVFEGKTPMPGVSIYTPKPDPTGDGRTEAAPPKEVLGGGLMMYGALAVGVGLLIAGVSPLLVFGLLLAGAAAMLFVFNRKRA